jgi:hypothetical protein
MTITDKIKAVQRAVNVDDDGDPQGETWDAIYKAIVGTPPIVTRSVGKFPEDTESAIRAFYGPPGEDHLVRIALPYPMRIAWDTKQIVTHTRCHKLVADSLRAILSDLLEQYGSLDQLQRFGLDLFGGIYNYRRMRGGSAWSRHAWGIAIDLDPDRNGLHTPWPSQATMPLKAIEIFEKHGWKSYARSRGNDAMHFQATL